MANPREPNTIIDPEEESVREPNTKEAPENDFIREPNTGISREPNTEEE